MNDRYLFKAKTCNGEWVIGLLAHKDSKYYISNKVGMPFAYEVRPDTICQSTSLKDKAGKLIWENDIVLWRDKRYAVKWYDSIGSFVITLPSGHWNHMEINYGDKLECFDYEVIGSYIDNPELLEVE